MDEFSKKVRRNEKEMPICLTHRRNQQFEVPNNSELHHCGSFAKEIESNESKMNCSV